MGTYRIFGSEMSPYSVKVRSYFRFKGIPHEWIVRNQANADEFRRYARLPLIPLVITPDGKGLQDSTPIIEAMEASHPEPAVHPADPTLRFLSALIEEYGDEWGNKHMFHYRWHYEPDQRSAAERIVRSTLVGAGEAEIAAAAKSVRERMVPRLGFVGSSPETKDQIEASFHRCLALLERHLAGRPFLFGTRPVFADFGLFAQFYQAATDPTAGALMRNTAPKVLAWTTRMLEPQPTGEIERWESLASTLKPLLKDEIGALFLPWSTANAAALAADQKNFAVELDGRTFSQEPQKYHARSLADLKARYAVVAERQKLDAILNEAGCLRWLQS
jgi:glutathione S-transferase